MADNSLRTPGSGETIASDDVGGAKYQRVKFNVGADGARADVEPPDADGKASASLLPAGAMLWNGTAWYRVRSMSGTAGDATTGNDVMAVGSFAFNGTTYDRVRTNTEGTLLSSAARTSNTTSANQTNHNARGVIAYLNITVASGTGGLRLVFKGVDVVSGNNANLTALPAAIIATGIYAYELAPGSSSAAPGGGAGALAVRNAGSLPRSWGVFVDHGDGSSYTYSVGYALVL